MKYPALIATLALADFALASPTRPRPPGPSASPAVAGHSRAELEGEIQLLMQWLPGEYDNEPQIRRQRERAPNGPGTAAVYPIHSLFHAVVAPQFGAHVVYLEEYRSGDPAQITRIRLFTFEADEAADAIRLKLLNPLDQKTLLGALGDYHRIERLDAAQVRPDRDNCIVWLKWVGGQFEGKMTPRACDRGDAWVDYEMVIGPSYHWVRSTTRRLKDDSVQSQMLPGNAWLAEVKEP